MARSLPGGQVRELGVRCVSFHPFPVPSHPPANWADRFPIRPLRSTSHPSCPLSSSISGWMWGSSQGPPYLSCGSLARNSSRVARMTPTSRNMTDRMTTLSARENEAQASATALHGPASIDVSTSSQLVPSAGPLHLSTPSRSLTAQGTDLGANRVRSL